MAALTVIPLMGMLGILFIGFNVIIITVCSIQKHKIIIF